MTDSSSEAGGGVVEIRRVRADDLTRIVELDAQVTGTAKPVYWQDIFERYATRRLDERFFLIAEPGEGADRELLGFIVGEVRGWEFGSEPCGWIFAFSVDPQNRQQGVGEQLFQAIATAFKAAGIATMRTMVARQNRLHMAFFRSEGMVAGPYIQLEMDIED